MIEIRVTSAGLIGKVNRYTVLGKKKTPPLTPLCLPVNSTTPRKAC